MTRARAKSAPAKGGKRRYEIKVRGHATGSVEVCAAISALCYTLAGWLDVHSDLCDNKHITLKDANADITFEVIPSADTDKLDTAYEMFLCGMEMIAKSYPEFLQFEVNTTIP